MESNFSASWSNGSLKLWHCAHLSVRMPRLYRYGKTLPLLCCVAQLKSFRQNSLDPGQAAI